MQYQQLWSRNAKLPIAVVIFATVAAAVSYAAAPLSKQMAAAQPRKPSIRNAYGHLPLSFEENRGQTDARVKFLARGHGYSLFLTPTEAVLELRASSPKKPPSAGAIPVAFSAESAEKQKLSVVRIRLEGSNPASSASGVDVLPGRSNYFIGQDRSKWRTRIATYGGVRFESIYPGINLVYRGTQGRLEYDFVVAPNADPSRIRMNVEGADGLALDHEGNLVIKTSGGEVIQKAPVIYQEAHGTKHPVVGGYVLLGKHSVAFKLEAYDRNTPLIIDPLLTYVSYLGGSTGDEIGVAIAVDSTGAAWVTGTTTSTDFPVAADALQPNSFGNFDLFITKVSSDGTSLVYSTYAGGSEADFPDSIALDAAGNAYVTGFTRSSDYPVSVGAFQTTTSSEGAFVTALDPSGGLIYSTFLGNESTESGIAVNPAGEAWVTGVPGRDFPTTPDALQSSCPVQLVTGCFS